MMIRKETLLLSVLALVAVLSLPTWAQNPQHRPFHGIASGYFIDSIDDNFPKLHQTTMGTGTNTALGNYSWAMVQNNTVHLETNPPYIEITGTLFCIAADGDWLYVDAVGTVTLPAQSVTVTTEITGGTGRFANATGEGLITGYGNNPPGTVGPLLWNGWISY